MIERSRYKQRGQATLLYKHSFLFSVKTTIPSPKILRSVLYIWCFGWLSKMTTMTNCDWFRMVAVGFSASGQLLTNLYYYVTKKKNGNSRLKSRGSAIYYVVRSSQGARQARVLLYTLTPLFVEVQTECKAPKHDDKHLISCCGSDHGSVPLPCRKLS